MLKNLKTMHRNLYVSLYLPKRKKNTCQFPNGSPLTKDSKSMTDPFTLFKASITSSKNKKLLMNQIKMSSILTTQTCIFFLPSPIRHQNISLQTTSKCYRGKTLYIDGHERIMFDILIFLII